jgi:hypothetical protein
MSSSLLSIGSYTDQDTLYLAAKILPKGKGTRSNFHLALLLDTSGSMDGDRITALKRTLHLLVDSLVDKDCLTIISYSSEAHIHAKGTVLNAETRTELHGLIDGLIADGGTNMEAAIVALREADLSIPVDSVFILTDGHINQGITGGAGLQTLLVRSIPIGTPVNTLGFGTDHNSKILRDMAMRSCGTYTFADKDELLPAIIGDIVGGLQSTVGKRGKITIPEGWTCCELGEVENGIYSTGTLIAEKPQWVVMKAPTGTAKPNITFEWLAGLVTHMISYTTNVVSEMDIASQRDRCFVAKVFVEASAAIEQDNRSQARTILRDAKTVLDRSIAKDTTFVVQLYAQIDQMLEEIQHMAPAAILSRMATGTAVLGNQRGILTGGDPRAFSSPLQVNTSSQMTTRYSQEIEEMDSINNVD